jgi:hypothetical protein
MGGFSVWEKVVSEPSSPNNMMNHDLSKKEMLLNSRENSPPACNRHLKTTEDKNDTYRKKIIKIREEDRSDTAKRTVTKHDSLFSTTSRLEILDRAANLNSKFPNKHAKARIKEKRKNSFKKGT